VHWHANGGLNLNMPLWSGYTRYLGQAIAVSAGFSSQAQFIPNLIFSGVLERYPRLKFVCAEAGIGWVNYILEGCDHEWEQRHLWTEGIRERPSDLFRRQLYVNFWYEEAGIELRHNIGVKNIMWEADYPHTTSTYPTSWDFVERTLKGVPVEERKLLCYQNAIDIYHL
jgi:predicted TIM-barrel fold metal-dependent hydrolase